MSIDSIKLLKIIILQIEGCFKREGSRDSTTLIKEGGDSIVEVEVRVRERSIRIKIEKEIEIEVGREREEIDHVQNSIKDTNIIIEKLINKVNLR